jgi:hypothetical protein
MVAMAFVAVCTASLADSLSFSTSMISYNQRRAIVQNNLQSAIDELKAAALTALPSDGTTNNSFTISGSRTVSVTATFTRVGAKNLTQLVISASWPETRGTRSFNDTMSFEVYMRGPDL